MKRFVIISVRAGVFIVDTDVKPKPQKNLIVADVDTIEEAIAIRDKRRIEIQDQKSAADDRWHDQWNKAEEKGDLAKLMFLSGANK